LDLSEHFNYFAKESVVDAATVSRLLLFYAKWAKLHQNTSESNENVSIVQNNARPPVYLHQVGQIGRVFAYWVFVYRG
jgi:hypothetical protein